ncbi:hypothetical protein PInf_011716 [Phytophthora infestans]|nr:hypothetical protein PInf_011716 [Phytophthora infestans]
MTLSYRCKIKLKAFKDRLSFFSLCIETSDFFGFFEELDKSPQLFWLGGPPSRSSSDTRKDDGAYAEDLTSLVQRDRFRYQATLENTLSRQDRLVRIPIVAGVSNDEAGLGDLRLVRVVVVLGENFDVSDAFACLDVLVDPVGTEGFDGGDDEEVLDDSGRQVAGNEVSLLG